MYKEKLKIFKRMIMVVSLTVLFSLLDKNERIKKIIQIPIKKSINTEIYVIGNVYRPGWYILNTNKISAYRLSKIAGGYKEKKWLSGIVTISNNKKTVNLDNYKKRSFKNSDK